MTNPNVFHAHVCVQYGVYARVSNDLKSRIPDWPHRKYVTRQWKADRNPEKYLENVRGYPYKTYIKDEIKEWDRKQKERYEIEGISIFEDQQLLWHPSEAKVAIETESTTSQSEKDMVEHFGLLERFAISRGMSGEIPDKGDEFGCHICLILGQCEY